MINISQLNYVSAPVQEKARACYVRRLSPTEFLVTPKQYSKSRRIVSFLLSGKVVCVDRLTGEECPANAFGLLCYHVEKAAEHLIRLEGRKAA